VHGILRSTWMPLSFRIAPIILSCHSNRTSSLISPATRVTNFGLRSSNGRHAMTSEGRSLQPHPHELPRAQSKYVNAPPLPNCPTAQVDPAHCRGKVSRAISLIATTPCRIVCSPRLRVPVRGPTCALSWFPSAVELCRQAGFLQVPVVFLDLRHARLGRVVRLRTEEAQDPVAECLQTVGDAVVVDTLPWLGVPLQAVHVDQQLGLVVEIGEVGSRQHAAIVHDFVLFGWVRQGTISPDGLQQPQFLRRLAAFCPRLIPLGTFGRRWRRSGHRRLDRSLFDHALAGQCPQVGDRLTPVEHLVD